MEFRVIVQFTGRREPISMSGAGKAAWRYTAPTALFFVADLPARNRSSSCGTAPDRTVPGENAVSLSDAIAVMTRFGHLLDFPEHPHKRSTQADDNAQEKQRQAPGL